MRLLGRERPTLADIASSEAAKAFDPFHPSYVADPYPIMARMREAEPTFYSPTLDSFVVLRHASISAVLRDPTRFSPGIASDPVTPLCPNARQIIAESEFDVPPLLVNNGSPNHPHCRRFFGEPLKAARLRALQDFTTQTVDRYIDQMIAEGPPSDLAALLTWDVPALVLFRLLGVPDEDVPKAKAYADSRVLLLFGRPSEEEQVRLTQASLDFFRYTSKLVHARLAEPRDDYPSDLIRQRAGDDSKATIRDIIGVTFNLLFAGHETTSSASANILLSILSRRDIWQGIVDGELEIEKVVDEGLRFDPPVQAWRRQALEDVEIDGVSIPAGSHLLLVFAAGNRDEALFDHADVFDPERPNAQQHLTFGIGPHFCLGAPLARLEIATIIRQLAKRLPGLTISPDHVGSYLPNISVRGLRRLPVIW